MTASDWVTVYMEDTSCTVVFWKLVLSPRSRAGDACPPLNEDTISETWASRTWGGGRPLWRWNALQRPVKNENNRSLAEEFRRGEGGELGLHYMLDWKHILRVSAERSSSTSRTLRKTGVAQAFPLTQHVSENWGQTSGFRGKLLRRRPNGPADSSQSLKKMYRLDLH